MRAESMRRAISSIVLSLFTLGAASAPERPRVTLGAILPMTGPQAPFGKEAERGIQLALEAQKLADPAAGAAWTLVVGDDQSSAKESGVAAERLIAKDKVHLLLGSVTGPATLELAEVARARQRPLIVPLAITQSVASGPFIARACFDEAMQGAILGEFLATTLGAKSAAVLRDDSASAAGIAAAFEAALKARGGAVVATEAYDVAAEDFAPKLAALKAKGVKYVLLPASYTTAAAVMKQAKAAGGGLVFLGTEAWDTPRFTSAAADAGQGHYFVTHFAADDKSPLTAAFIAAFTAKFGRAPGSIAALAYDATLMAAEGVKRAGSNQAGAVMTELGRLKDWDGVTGTVTHGATGNFLKSGIVKTTTLRGADFKARIMPLVAGGAPAGATAAAASPAAPGSAAAAPAAAGASGSPAAPAPGAAVAPTPGAAPGAAGTPTPGAARAAPPAPSTPPGAPPAATPGKTP